MKPVLALAVALGCFAAGPRPGRAQPTGAPPADKAAADLEFNRARQQFDAWCKQLDEAHARDPRDLRVTLRLADCRRLNGQLDEARKLLEAAESKLGGAAVAEAQRAADAELGRRQEARGPEVQWAQACRHFEESLRLDVSIAAQLAVAACQLRRGDLGAARALLATCTSTLEPLATGDEFRAVQLRLARALAVEVDRVQPRLIVKTPAGFGGAIEIDDRAAAADAVVPLDPGAHTVRATLRDGRVEETIVELAPHTAHTVSITRGPHRSHGRKLAFWSLAGAGLAATATAGASLWAMEAEVDRLAEKPYGQRCSRPSSFTLECDPGVSTRSFKARATLFQISAIGAGVLLAGAAAVYFTAPRGERLRIAPALDHQTVGVAAAGHF